MEETICTSGYENHEWPFLYVDDSTVTNFSKGLRFNGGCDGRRGGHGDRGRGGGLMVELRDRNNGESWNELEVLVVESEKAVVASSEKMAVMVVEKSWSHGGGERDCRQVFPAMLNVGIDKQRLIEERLCLDWALIHSTNSAVGTSEKLWMELRSGLKMFLS
ncbi:hypothetical protein G4B88_018391 [Cannabis sativa]|uniref:Uncharacterized protein n=2 Tax=Cannabis sativa TaxID=3483 RepID=A0A7J6E096_CANSA|nr:hypothetical protein G4B88_018391 [Cannabis sativa]